VAQDSILNSILFTAPYLAGIAAAVSFAVSTIAMLACIQWIESADPKRWNEVLAAQRMNKMRTQAALDRLIREGIAAELNNNHLNRWISVYKTSGGFAVVFGAIAILALIVRRALNA
jgi:hypothetical protein